MNAHSVSLNDEVIKELKDMLGDGFTDLIDTFISDSVTHIETLEKLAGLGDAMAMEHSAHALKGTSANIGAAAMNEAAADLVTQCRNGHVPDPIASVARIRACFSNVVPVLQRHCGQ